jgi:hypothetical protein
VLGIRLGAKRIEGVGVTEDAVEDLRDIIELNKAIRSERTHLILRADKVNEMRSFDDEKLPKSFLFLVLGAHMLPFLTANRESHTAALLATAEWFNTDAARSVKAKKDLELTRKLELSEREPALRSILAERQLFLEREIPRLRKLVEEREGLAQSCHTMVEDFLENSFLVKDRRLRFKR